VFGRSGFFLICASCSVVARFVLRRGARPDELIHRAHSPGHRRRRSFTLSQAILWENSRSLSAGSHGGVGPRLHLRAIWGRRRRLSGPDSGCGAGIIHQPPRSHLGFFLASVSRSIRPYRRRAARIEWTVGADGDRLRMPAARLASRRETAKTGSPRRDSRVAIVAVSRSWVS